MKNIIVYLITFLMLVSVLIWSVVAIGLIGVPMALALWLGSWWWLTLYFLYPLVHRYHVILWGVVTSIIWSGYERFMDFFTE